MRDQDQLIVSLMAVALGALFWWVRASGLKSGKLGIKLSPDFSRDEQPRAFSAISWFYLAMSIFWSGFGLLIMSGYVMGR